MFMRKLLINIEIFRWRQSAAALLGSLAVAFCLAVVPLAHAQVPGSLDDSEIDEQVEDTVEDTVEESVNEQAEEVVEETIDDALDELLLGPGDRIVEEKVEEEVEDEVQDSVEDVVEDVAEEEVEESVEDAVEDTVEEQVADTVTEDVEEDVEESVEETVEETVAENVEENIAESVQESVQDEVAENVEDSVAENVEESVASDTEEEVAASVEEAVAKTVEEGVEGSVQSSVEDTVEVKVAVVVEERLDSEIDDILDDVESGLEVDEERIHREQWLVMAEPKVFDELAEKGYLFDTVTDLPALGMRLAEVAGPSSFDITEVRRGVLDVVGKDRAEVDLNHIYTAGTELAATDEGRAPRSVLEIPAGSSPARIGMIDSRVDTSHPVLAASHIQSRDFVSAGADMPAFHGTAIASIIAGNAPDYQGLAPDAEVFAAGVFELDAEQGEIASTVSLLRALDWLISSEVDVVNISLAGPPNRLLEAALTRAAERDVVVLAAAGNGGPVARPMYPAAYETVVAVTAVDASNRVFRLANRGSYLDIAAPGVGLLHARAGGGFAASSGTSFAVPFAATAAANLIASRGRSDVMALLYASAMDLGPPGRDDIYGYGLLRLQDG